MNGFFSVIGSVLTTILSMTFGFRTVQFAALVVYVIAVFAFSRLALRRARVLRASAEDRRTRGSDPDLQPSAASATTATAASTASDGSAAARNRV